MRVVYYSLIPHLGFRGSRYGVGELIPGMAELSRNRPSAAVRAGRIAPVLFDTLPAAAKKDYEADFEVLMADVEPEPVEAEPDVEDEPEAEAEAEPEKATTGRKST